MKRLRYILIIFSFYLLFSGKSCVDDSERTAWQEKEITAIKDSLRIEFETDYLTEDTRLSFGPIKNKKIKNSRIGDFLEEGFGKDTLKVWSVLLRDMVE